MLDTCTEIGNNGSFISYRGAKNRKKSEEGVICRTPESTILHGAGSGCHAQSLSRHYLLGFDTCNLSCLHEAKLN